MNEDPPKSPVLAREPVDDDVLSTEMESIEAEIISEAASAREPLEEASELDPLERPSSDSVPKRLVEIKDEPKATGGEPPIDWFEPLEEDDDVDSVTRNDPEEESVAGESERSESVAGSEKAFKKMYQPHVPRRKRSHPDEGWVEWQVLGEGWKRKEVVRRSGSSIGQKDIYYMSPRGDRVRSRVELLSVLEGCLDLANFDYKSGKFYDGQAPPTRVRNRVKKRVRERSSSESSWMERGEGADTPDSLHRLTPIQVPKNIHCNQTSVSSQNAMGTLKQDSRSEALPEQDRIRLPPPSSLSKLFPLPSINGDLGSEDNTLVCAKCGISFEGTWYDKQRKRPCCPTCWGKPSYEMLECDPDWAPSLNLGHSEVKAAGTERVEWLGRRVTRCQEEAVTGEKESAGQANNSSPPPPDTASKTKEHPMIRFRKWIPCGECVGCRNTINCGQCANCKHGLQSPESRKRICRKRKCICPIRKGSGSTGFMQQRSFEILETFDDSTSFQGEVTDSQHPSFKSSDTENVSVNVDIEDEEDLSTDDDDDWHKKRKRRSCGECKACLCRKDCGTCDFCIDKPKFGGSNKKRQKCRLRQCQRQAMRHLLPFQMGQGDYGPDGTLLPGRPRPHYTYSRKSAFKKSRGASSAFDLTDEEDDSTMKAMNWSDEPASSSKHPFELNQLNHLDYGQQNGLPDGDLYTSNHNNSELEQLSRWDAEKSHTGRDGEKHIDEEEEEEEFPMQITQIFSLADNPVGSGADVENQLMKLLHSLRSSVLPILWYAIMVEGPQLQLIQCSKQSNMTDTMVLIDPGFYYQVTVQKQPLLPTHPLYDNFPGRLTSVTEVVDLLLGLEKYVVCRGLPPKEHLFHRDPLIFERASTCDFLVKGNVRMCNNCRALLGL